MIGTYTFGIEVEAYLPQGTSQTELASAISHRLGRSSACAVEGYNHLRRDHWKIVPDGSLGDYARGIEVVSPPLNQAQGHTDVAKVLSAMNDFGCTVTKRCGLHVHVGGHNASMQTYKNVFKLYAVYEPVIDGFMPPSRRGSANTFLRSITNASVDAIDRTTSVEGLMRLQVGAAARRYYKVNFESLQRHGTLEFRQHSGTLDPAKVRNWVSFCLRLVDRAQRGGDLGITQATGTTLPAMNRARRGSKARIVGDLLLRPQGVSRSEAMAATGWPSISLPQQAEACGIAFTTQRMGREVRYYARGAQASVTVTPTLERLMDTTELDADERVYFVTRTTDLAGPTAWAA